MKLFPNLPAVIRGRAEEQTRPITQCTWDPEGPGVVRLHLVAPRFTLRRAPSVLHINGGQYILLVNSAWAALLRCFIEELNEAYQPGVEVGARDMKIIVRKTVDHMRRLYPDTPEKVMLEDLDTFQGMIIRLARGEEVPELANIAMDLEKYAPFMRGPFRMDLAVMPMSINDRWSCPLRCIPCYAATGKAMQVAKGEELTTDAWFEVLDTLWEIGIPQVSFTGGEPLARKDIVDLVEHAQSFTTRINTSAVLLTRELARQLHDRGRLDVMQVTLYSHIPEIHDECVGVQGAWEKTMRGITLAMEAGIQVSINTPLLPANAPHYTETIAYLEKRGLCSFTCSGVLPAGKAKELIAEGKALSKAACFATVHRAKVYARSRKLELEFTSPGWFTESQIKELGMNLSVCGACQGNMAISPTGEVLPCQSWVEEKVALGNILTTPWSKIWDHPMCKNIRKQASLKNACPLSEV